jgi:hypothetical protein
MGDDQSKHLVGGCVSLNLDPANTIAINQVCKANKHMSKM